jgi:zinc transport system substrate-binding protein
MITLENADILVYNGSGMESWTDSALSALSNKDLIVVEASNGLSDLTADSEDGSGTSADPHVWLDPEFRQGRNEGNPGRIHQGRSGE